MPRVLLLLPTTTYRTEAFLAAASRLDVDVTVASERPNTLADLNPAALLKLDFQDHAQAVRQLLAFSESYPIDAIVPVDSQVVIVGAALAAASGIRSNSVEAATVARDKYRMRERFRQAEVASPRFMLCSLGEDRESLAARVEYPCVVKPLALAGSQGVIRADNERQFLEAVNRLERILLSEYGAKSSLSASRKFLVEQFVGGPEVALEGMLTRGELQVLAVFDKPDPLDGPFFEETIYATPSRLSVEMQDAVARSTQQATRALGLSEGPIHAELRLAEAGPTVIEINPRSIGGFCSRVLRFGTGVPLEELILRHALEEQFDPPQLKRESAGVMMIPIPAPGRLRQVNGVDRAKSVVGIEDVTISAHPGQILVPLPEGSGYLGFIFARGDSPQSVEAALRDSHGKLEFVVERPSSSDVPSVDDAAKVAGTLRAPFAL